MTASGLTGRVALKMVPATKTASEVAAIEPAEIAPAPVKVMKSGWRLLSNLAMKEFGEAADALAKAEPEVGKSMPEVVVPVT